MRIITLPTFQSGEIAILRQLLAWPDVYVHVRKPDLSETDYVNYLCAFSVDERKKLVAHQAYDRAADCGVERIHFSTLRRQTLGLTSTAKQHISTSTHSWDEFNGLVPVYDAAFVSPLFPSISKRGYGLENTIPESGRRNRAIKAIALGGISSARLATMTAHEFDDFALCGALWEANDPLREATSCLALAQLFSDRSIQKNNA
jgi:thiamine-phosphate pyrophosphorylase